MLKVISGDGMSRALVIKNQNVQREGKPQGLVQTDKEEEKT